MITPWLKKAFSALVIYGLLAAALCPARASATEPDNCTSNKVAAFMPDETKKRESSICAGGDTQCRSQLSQFAKIAEDYAKEIKQACGALQATMKAPELSSDSQQLERANQLRQTAAAQTKSLAEIALKSGQKAGQMLQANLNHLQAPPAGASPDAHRRDFEAIRSKVGAPKEVLKASEVTGPLRPKAGAFEFGSSLRKTLLEAKDEFDEASNRIANLGNKDSNGSGDKSETKKGGGMLDSINPNTLLGLATAGAGLMAAMKKNPNQSEVSNAPTSPTEGPSTAPVTPTGLTNPSGTTAASQKLDMSNDANKAMLSRGGEGGAPSFGSSGYNPAESGVTTHSSALGSGGTGSIAPASSSGGGLVGSMGGSGGASKSPEAGGKDLASLNARPADEGAGAFSAGGGGSAAGALSFGSPSSADASHAEDPLRDTLHDMGVAVDSNPNGLGGGTPADGSASEAGGIEGESSDMLFSRVKAAIQRSVKKGLVVNGLTAKIR